MKKLEEIVKMAGWSDRNLVDRISNKFYCANVEKGLAYLEKHFGNCVRSKNNWNSAKTRNWFHIMTPCGRILEVSYSLKAKGQHSGFSICLRKPETEIPLEWWEASHKIVRKRLILIPQTV